MTDFDTLRVKMGRRPVTIVELDVDVCENVYGVAPCTAVLGVSGSQKCFNTFQTCQDRPNFSKTTKTYRFCDENAFLPVGEEALPCVSNVSIAPTQLDPKGLSVSAAVTVTLKDFPHHDRGYDPYTFDRTYDAREQGTFWGKFRARNPFLINRQMRIITGYVADDNVIHTRSRTYFFDRMEGPDANGVVKLIGKDPLRFAETDAATVPVASKGNLDATINSGAISLVLSPAGVGAEYPSFGRVRIDDELINFSGRSGDTLTGLTRAQAGTTAASHAAATKVQVCKYYSAETIDAVLADLLVNFAGISSTYIPTAEWAAESATWLGSFLCTVTLSQPAPLKDIIKELLLATGSVVWWDEVQAKFRWKVIAPLQPSGEVPLLTEEHHILEGSLRVKDLEKERLSRVFMYLDEISKIGEVDRKNFRTVAALIDTDSESTNAYGATKLLEILNRWMPASVPLADEIIARLLTRYNTTPREAEFKLDAKDFTINTGDIVDLQSRHFQQADGSTGSARFLVTECQEVEIGSHAAYTGILIDPVGGGQSWLIADDAQDDWTSASSGERGTYMFISDDAGFMSDLAPAPRIG